MKRFLVTMTLVIFTVTVTVQGPEAKFFTDPSVNLEQSDWEGKKKSKAPEEEYQQTEEQKEEPVKKEEKKEKKKKQRRKKTSSSGQQRKKYQFGLKVGYNLIPKTEVDSGSGFTEIWQSGSRYSFDLGMEFVINILKGHLGLGLGVGTSFDYWSGYDSYAGEDVTEITMYVPVYFLIKGYLLKGHSPFVSMGLGYNVYTLFTSDSTLIDNVNSTSGGFYFSIGGGFITKGGIQIEIVYAMTKAGINYSSGGYSYSLDAKNSHLTIGVAKFF